MSQALTFNGHTFSPIFHQGTLWIRSAELSKALGYSREDTISRLYQKNADEFTEEMTQTIEIPVEHRNGVLGNLSAGRCRIFSLRGCHLLAMFARTPVAKAFRKWVLDVLDKLNTEQPMPKTTPAALPLSSVADRKPLRSLVNAWSSASGLPHNACWAQVRAAFNLTRIDELPVDWVADAIAWVQEKLDNLPKMLAQGMTQPSLPALPATENKPVYRNGAFHLPSVNQNRKAGPAETALEQLWKTWGQRERELEHMFNSMLEEINNLRGDAFNHLVSDVARNTDAAFSPASLLRTFHHADDLARNSFRHSLELAYQHLQFVLNVSILQGR